MNTQSLRDLVVHQVETDWPRFAAEHPNLAAAVDRVSLVETAVKRLRDDPAFVAAMERAAVDGATLEAMRHVRRWVERAVAAALAM